jgi:hypothetical protein
MKVSISSQRKLESNIQQLGRKVKQLKEKNKKLSKQSKYQKGRIKSLTEGRDSWKAKSTFNSLEKRELEKKLDRSKRVKRHQYPLPIITLCIKLRTLGGCSYRSICRILLILQTSKLLSIKKLPCANSIENWVSKIGLYCIENTAENMVSNECCLILDESMSQGNERILLMLLTPFQKERTEALNYKDVTICYLGGQSSWTGEKIKAEVEKIIAKTGVEIKQILSDEDSKLLKAGVLLQTPHLPDVNHAVANCLRKVFENNEEYKKLVKQISAFQSKSVNQDLSFLRPPKQRTKARFMNHKAFVKWGINMLENFEKLSEKERAFYSELLEHRAMLKKLEQCIDIAEQIVMPLKTEGLSNKTIKQVDQIISKQWFTKTVYSSTGLTLKHRYVEFFKPVAARSTRRMITKFEDKQDLFRQFLAHVEIYIDRYNDFVSTHEGCYNVSTDVIESLFGKHKTLKRTNPLIGISQLDLELPIHNIKIEQLPDITKTALEATFIASLKAFIDTHSSDNQASKRLAFFKKSA